ncbi:MAG: AarF/UbiB family protein [Anaerolineaceae bacterium]
MLRIRYLRILFFFARLLLVIGFYDILLPVLGLGALSRNHRNERYGKLARSYRKFAISMGGVLIKVGQFLSMRLDVLPPAIIKELTGLQDEVAAAPFDKIKAVIENEFGVPLAEKFVYFDETALAAASIGQVHIARIRVENQNEDQPVTELPLVVVKVQRPQIEEIVKIDLRALSIVSRWLMSIKFVRKRADVPKLMEEFSRSLYEEIDYLNEGKNAEIFAENFRENPGVLVPAVYWSHTTRRVLTLEDVRGIKIDDNAAIEAAGIACSEVAIRLMNVYLQQIFDDHFFHADPHSGNLFVYPVSGGEAGEWKLAFVDFGMTGKINKTQIEGLRDILIAIGLSDSDRVIDGFQKIDLLLPGADINSLKQATQKVMTQIYGKTNQEIFDMDTEEAMQLVKEFEHLLYEMPFQIPDNFILLGRCMSILAGLATHLDPAFNIWLGVVPYVQKVVNEEKSESSKQVLHEIVNLLQITVSLPKRVDNLLKQVEAGQLDITSSTLNERIFQLERSNRKIAFAIVFAGCLMAGVFMSVNGNNPLAIVLGGVAIVFLALVLRP